jgi:hypothetical protein
MFYLLFFLLSSLASRFACQRESRDQVLQKLVMESHGCLGIEVKLCIKGAMIKLNTLNYLVLFYWLFFPYFLFSFSFSFPFVLPFLIPILHLFTVRSEGLKAVIKDCYRIE